VRLAERVLAPPHDPRAAPANKPGAWPVTHFVYAAPPDADWEAAWHNTEALLAALRRDVESAGAKFVVMIVPGSGALGLVLRNGEPIPGSDGARWDLDYPRRRLVGVLDRLGIDYVDTTADLQASEMAAPTTTFFPYDMHLGVDGHRVVAHVLARKLEGLSVAAATER
jgi:hypothetical protein